MLVASTDAEATEWLATVLGGAGYTVVVIPNVEPTSPELKVVDVAIVDGAAASRLGAPEGPIRILMAPRGGTIDIAGLRESFSDVIVVPSDPDEVVARVQAVHRSDAQ